MEPDEKDKFHDVFNKSKSLKAIVDPTDLIGGFAKKLAREKVAIRGGKSQKPAGRGQRSGLDLNIGKNLDQKSNLAHDHPNFPENLERAQTKPNNKKYQSQRSANILPTPKNT